MLFSLSLFLSFLHLYRILSFYRHPNIHCYYKYLQSAGKVGWGAPRSFRRAFGILEIIVEIFAAKFFLTLVVSYPVREKEVGLF